MFINKLCLFSCRKFFTARVYAKLLHSDPYGRISIMQFFNYVMRKGVELVFTFNYLHLPDWTSWHWSVFTSALPSSLAASDTHRSEPVWCSRTGLPQRVGQLHIFFFSIRREIMVCCSLETVGWQLWLGAGSGELHPGADPYSASARWTGEVLLLFLRLHRRSQVLFLPRPTSNRCDRITLTKIDQEK